MFSKQLFTRAFPLYLSNFSKQYSTMASAVPPQSFALNRSIFNDSLYTHIRSFWFAGLAQNERRGNNITAKRWWGKDATPEDRKNLDAECANHYAEALDSISPTYLALSPFVSYEQDRAQAEEISAPLLSEVRSQGDAKKSSDTLLSFIILLDQMSRNIHRDPAGLRLIYTHYDRLAFTLLHASPPIHDSYRAAAAYRTWFTMPLMHAEDLWAQDRCIEMTEVLGVEHKEEDGEVPYDVTSAINFGKEHREIIERFGRFPHRNECLGRESTPEEKEWLKTGNTFGVQQNQAEDEGKSEL